MRPLRHPQQYIDALRQADLVETRHLKEFVTQLRGMSSLSVRKVGEYAVRSGLLTCFQSREVMAGRADQLMLKHYRLLDKLGSGGMGDVYLAVDLRTGRRRAIKILAGSLIHNAIARQRLEREAQVAACMDHPNIVRVHEFDCYSRVHPPHIVMDYVDGVSLHTAISLVGTFPVNAVAEYGRQVAQGLQYAWDRRCVHRDVKPANLLLDRAGRVKLLDLGIVRLLEHVGLTTSGSTGKQILGTFEYLAPEQALDSSTVDCRADIYALGATLYFLLCGHPPFTDKNPMQLLQRKQHEDSPRIDTLRPDVPSELSAILARMLAKTVGDRYAVPIDVATALSPWAQGGETFHLHVFEQLAKNPEHVRASKACSTSIGGRAESSRSRNERNAAKESSGKRSRQHPREAFSEPRL
jgi:serine/threonine protein kinase